MIREIPHCAVKLRFLSLPLRPLKRRVSNLSFLFAIRLSSGAPMGISHAAIFFFYAEDGNFVCDRLDAKEDNGPGDLDSMSSRPDGETIVSTTRKIRRKTMFE